jgi:uncharacterized phage-like protein YoqJ
MVGKILIKKEKIMRVALTGHRPQRLGLPDDELDIQWIKIGHWIFNQILNVSDVYCGMANGSDILIGLNACVIKESYRQISPEMKKNRDLKLHCVLPCKNYNESNKYYSKLKNEADEWIELSDKFYKGCDNVRDQYMVDHCDVLLAIWDGNKSGGVWSTIRKAQKAGKQIIYCPKEILDIE